MHVREAREGDFEAILALCDGVFNDLDVFPYLLGRYIAAPNRLVYVAEDKHGDIVACCAAVVLDNGATYLGEGYRTAKKYHGAGIQHEVLGRPIYLELKKRFPAIRNFIRGASLYNGYIDGKTKASKMLLRHHITQLLMLFSPSPTKVADLANSRDRPGVHLTLDMLQMVSQRQFKQVLSDKAACERLFPYGLIYSHSEVYELLEGNITEMFEGRGATRVLGLPAQSGGRCNSRDRATRMHYGSLSFGLCLQIKKGWCFDISYFGSDEIGGILAHMMKQMTLLPKLAEQNAYVSLSLHKDKFGESTVKGVTDFLKTTGVTSEVSLHDQYVVDVRNDYLANL